MLLTCPTPYAILFCAVADGAGVLRIAVSAQAKATPGLLFAVAPLTPINVQLMAQAAAFFGTEVGRHLAIEQDYADPVASHLGEATLYLGRLDPAAGITAAADWPHIPAVLRQLNGRARIPYLRAWQVLAGGLQLATKAVDAAEVLKHFED